MRVGDIGRESGRLHGGSDAFVAISVETAPLQSARHNGEVRRAREQEEQSKWRTYG